ncbi:MAG TPA: 30S ribosome-binding factor RbfA [bacterium]|nr:30S ribosome-binding factor RbfA [bacterium]
MSVRIARLRELFKEEISTILQREMKDPRIGFVSVLDVELSQDLRHARVFVSILGDAEAKAKTMAGLGNAQGFIRKELGRRIRLRYMPEVSFRLDESIERGVRVQRLLRQVAETEGEASGNASGRSDRGNPSKSA